MNTMKIQTEILKELYKQCHEMSYETDDDCIFFAEGYYAVRIPNDKCYLNLDCEKIRRTYKLKSFFENNTNAYMAQATNVLRVLEPKILIRKIESGNGAVCCWVNEKIYKLFGDKYNYMITAPNKPVQVLENDTVIGVIQPIVLGSSFIRKDEENGNELDSGV